MNNRAVAHELGISVRTVEGHIAHVMAKLSVSKREEAIAYAISNGIVG